MIKRLLVFLSTLGLLDSIYLSWIKLSNQEALCSGIGSCDVVNGSEYSSIVGIPIAIFGAAAYITLLVALLGEQKNNFLKENGPLIVFGVSLFGFLYSLYLTYVELFVIYAICPYCVLSAIVMTVIFVLSWIRLRQHWSLD